MSPPPVYRQLVTAPLPVPWLVVPAPLKWLYFAPSRVVMSPHAATGGVTLAEGEGWTLALGIGLGFGLGSGAPGPPPGRRATSPMTATRATVARPANSRPKAFIVGNLHRTGATRSWRVVWIR